MRTEAKKFEASTPVLLAQDESRSVLLEIAKTLLPYYKEAVMNGWIQEFETELDTYNKGYRLVIDPLWSEETSKHEKPCMTSIVTIQPIGYFNEEYSVGRAFIQSVVRIGNEWIDDTFIIDNSYHEVKISETALVEKILTTKKLKL